MLQSFGNPQDVLVRIQLQPSGDAEQQSAVTEVTKTLDCLTKKTNCGTYTTHGTWPSLRGLMTWSINWDRFGGWEFSRNFDSYFG